MFTTSHYGKCGKLTMRNDVNVAGLAEAAAALQREAHLPRSVTPPNVLPAQPCVFSSPHLASPRIVSFTLHWLLLMVSADLILKCLFNYYFHLRKSRFIHIHVPLFVYGFPFWIHTLGIILEKECIICVCTFINVKKCFIEKRFLIGMIYYSFFPIVQTNQSPCRCPPPWYPWHTIHKFRLL